MASRTARPIRVVGQVGKRNLWLDHPELGEVAVVLSFPPGRWGRRCTPWTTRRRAFHIQLTRHRQERFPAEEVAGVVHRLYRCGQVLHVKRRDAEHFARAFAVTRGHDGRVPPGTVLVEEAVRKLTTTVRTRVIAPKGWCGYAGATSRKYSNVCRLAATG